MSEGIKILFATVFSYLSVFFYELGVSKVYGIPIQFINPDLNNLLIVGSISLALLFIVFTYIDSIYRLINLKSGDSLIKKLFNRHGFFLIIGVLITVLSSFHWRAALGFLLFPFLFLLLDLIPPLFDKEGKYSENLESWIKFQDENPDKGVVHESKNFGLHSYLVIFIFASYMLGILANVGYGEAKRKDVYPVTGNKVLLRVYGDSGIIGIYNPKDNMLNGSFELKPLSQYTFKIKKIGRLQKHEK